MITGFNTDIEHDGVVYHVQTEDKGLDSPLILSLVYSGGAILASKRTRYEDLIAAGFNEEVLVQRLQRQHRLICAAINAGRLEDLKRMDAKPAAVLEPDALVPDVPDVSEALATDVPGPTTASETMPEWLVSDYSTSNAPEVEDSPRGNTSQVEESLPVNTTQVEESSPINTAPLYDAVPPQTRGRSHPKESAYSLYDPRRQSPPSEVIAVESGVALSILDEDEFRAGESYNIRVLVEDRSGGKQKPLSGVGVSVKILGAAFRPQLHSVKTERDGVAVISTTMPSFKSGRAAVLITAVVKGRPIELRRVIHPAR